MKIAFFGTGEFSKNILNGILKYNNIKISLIVSQPDKPVGRKKELIPTPVKTLALENNIDVLQPKKLTPPPTKDGTRTLPLSGEEQKLFYNKLYSLDLDFIVVVAYGKIVPVEVLNAPKYGCINIHGSILPKYRGASPIQESIKNGDTETGLTIMYMSEGMDEGDIIDTQIVNIDNIDKTVDIFKKFEKIGPNLLINTLNSIVDNKIKGQKQNDLEATYCSKISKEDGKINFKKESGDSIYNKFRAYYPWPGIYSYYNGKKFNIEDCEIYKSEINVELNDFEIGNVIKLNKKNIGIKCLDNQILILKQIKLEGKKSMDILSFVNGNKDFLEYRF